MASTGPGDLTSQVAVVTGGARGIGASCVAALEAVGATVAVLDLDSTGVQGYRRDVDIRSTAQVQDAVAMVNDDLGPIDILIHAAGVSGPWMPLTELDEQTWLHVMDVNANGVFRLCKAVVPGMVQRGYGRIVCIASVAAKDGSPLLPAYSASKGAVVALVKSLGKDLAGTGVLVNCVTPAGVDTPMTDETPPAMRERMLAAIPMGRFARADEVAAMVCWLAGPQCSFSTGAIFDVSGGRSDY